MNDDEFLDYFNSMSKTDRKVNQEQREQLVTSQTLSRLQSAFLMVTAKNDRLIDELSTNTKNPNKMSKGNELWKQRKYKPLSLEVKLKISESMKKRSAEISKRMTGNRFAKKTIDI